MSQRVLVLVAIFAALSIGVVGVAVARDSSPRSSARVQKGGHGHGDRGLVKAVLRRCVRGMSIPHVSSRVLMKALRALPADVAEYTTCRARLQAAFDAAVKREYRRHHRRHHRKHHTTTPVGVARAQR